VNRSEWDTTLEVEEERDGAGSGAERAREMLPPLPSLPSPPSPTSAVRIGLSRITGLAQSTGERILAARARRAFASLADFVDRARPTPPELEALVLGGALDLTGRTRPALLLEARAGARRPPERVLDAVLVTPEGAELRPDPVAPVPVPELPEFDVAERVRGECRATGLWFSAHPLAVWVSAEARRGAVPAASLEAWLGRRVAVVGMPCARRRVETRGGGLMSFVTLADESGLAECVLFPDAYRAWAQSVHGEVVRVEGRVTETLGALSVTVERAAVVA
jgi:error-prone DNA polymerase